jgi:AcrR family transcriptional regulator
VSADERRAERRERIVDAALTLIASDGSGALTVHRTSRAAGLNERYFYESFSDRDDVVVAVSQGVAARIVSALVAAMAAAPDDPRSQAMSAIGAGVDLLVEDTRIGALLLESAVHPVLSKMREEFSTTLVGLMTDRAVSTLHLGQTAEVERDATFAATMLLGGLIEVLTRWTSGTLHLSRDELVERCVEMFLLVGDYAASAHGER